jgi:hypothetical protein
VNDVTSLELGYTVRGSYDHHTRGALGCGREAALLAGTRAVGYSGSTLVAEHLVWPLHLEARCSHRFHLTVLSSRGLPAVRTAGADASES